MGGGFSLKTPAPISQLLFDSSQPFEDASSCATLFSVHFLLPKWPTLRLLERLRQWIFRSGILRSTGTTSSPGRGQVHATKSVSTQSSLSSSKLGRIGALSHAVSRNRERR